jgi:hypothetical protein
MKVLALLVAIIGLHAPVAHASSCNSYAQGVGDNVTAGFWGDLQLMARDPFTATVDSETRYFGPRAYGPSFGYVRVVPGQIVTTTASVQWSLYCERWLTVIYVPMASN